MKCIYIYNPNSGKMQNAKLTNYIQKRLKTKFDDVVCCPTQKQGDASIIAGDACGACHTLVVAGGDGTINEVINAIATKENRPILGIIPTGTANDLAHSLNISKNLKKAVNIILNGNTTPFDIFKVNNRYGIYVCAFGIFTKATYLTKQIDKKRLGVLAYFKFGAKELFGTKAFSLKLTSDNVEVKGKFALGIIANSRFVAAHKINDRANICDGLVDVILVETKKEKVTINPLIKIANLFLFGLHKVKKDKDYKILQLSKFRVELPDNITLNIDGEKGDNGTFDFEVLPSHVNIYVK